MSRPRSPFGILRNFGSAVLVTAVSVGGGLSCSNDGFGDVRASRRLVVELVEPGKAGTRDAPLRLAVDTPVVFRVRVRALRASGAPDEAFTGYVRLGSKPGAIGPLAQNDTTGRNVLLTAGVSPDVDVAVTNAYGTTYIVADDLGYIPGDPLATPPPKCANGIDDDGDGKIDFPADEGCAFADDDAEQGGSFAEGVSQPIFFALPRIADIRGLTCQQVGSDVACSSTGASPYPKEQVQIETGFFEGIEPRGTAKVVVISLASNGFFVQDITDDRKANSIDPLAGFTGLFAFNFNTPPRMRTCDRIRTLRGTAGEFFGFTQLSYPTWTLQEWDPRFTRCEVPAPTVLTPGVANDKAKLLRLSGALVRAESGDGLTVKVTRKFGSGKPPEVNGIFDFGPSEEEAKKDEAEGKPPRPTPTNCDFDDNGKIVFGPTSKEGLCSQACTADPECTEFSNFRDRGTFRLTIADSGNQLGAIQADASQSAGFDPLAQRGKVLRAFSGILTYFSGGSQFTVEARCSDDIIADPKGTPFAPDTRTDAQLKANAEASAQSLPLPFPPPPLACVRPRTDLELNPQ
jgi:hypothetical protein